MNKNIQELKDAGAKASAMLSEVVEKITGLKVGMVIDIPYDYDQQLKLANGFFVNNIRLAADNKGLNGSVRVAKVTSIKTSISSDKHLSGITAVVYGVLPIKRFLQGWEKKENIIAVVDAREYNEPKRNYAKLPDRDGQGSC